jgi:hypothetical protein
MSLPGRQQRVLHEIEDALQASEQRMASMFAIFTRLTQDEGPPALRERLTQFRLVTGRWLHVLVAAAFGAVIALLVTAAILAPASGVACPHSGTVLSAPAVRAVSRACSAAGHG